MEKVGDTVFIFVFFLNLFLTVKSHHRDISKTSVWLNNEFIIYKLNSCNKDDNVIVQCAEDNHTPGESV